MINTNSEQMRYILTHKKGYILLLEETKKIINKGWTKNVVARDKNGSSVHPLSSSACAWCLDGAIIKACETLDNVYSAHYLNLNDLFKTQIKKNYIGYINYNDKCKSKSQIIALLNKTISFLKSTNI